MPLMLLQALLALLFQHRRIGARLCKLHCDRLPEEFKLLKRLYSILSLFDGAKHHESLPFRLEILLRDHVHNFTGRLQSFLERFDHFGDLDALVDASDLGSCSVSWLRMSGMYPHT
jgi:hypothetical protein